MADTNTPAILDWESVVRQWAAEQKAKVVVTEKKEKESTTTGESTTKQLVIAIDGDTTQGHLTMDKYENQRFFCWIQSHGRIPMYPDVIACYSHKRVYLHPDTIRYALSRFMEVVRLPLDQIEAARWKVGDDLCEHEHALAKTDSVFGELVKEMEADYVVRFGRANVAEIK